MSLAPSAGVGAMANDARASALVRLVTPVAVKAPRKSVCLYL